MLSRIQPLGSCLIALTLMLSAGSAAAQDVSPSCEAAIDRAAGDYSRCLLRADASYARHENATKLGNRQARCEMRFDRRTSRAINRHGADACPSSDLVADIEDRTVSYAEGVAREGHGKAATDFVFVQHAEGGTLTESTLTLTDASRRTDWFAWSGHAHEAGEFSTLEFVAFINARDEASVSPVPLTVDFTLESGDEVRHYDLTLSDPAYDEPSDTVTYTVLEAKEDTPVATGSAGSSKSVQGVIHFGHAQVSITTLTARGSRLGGVSWDGLCGEVRNMCHGSGCCQADGQYNLEIDNGGLVLLGSYLGVLYDRAGFLENNVFVSSDAKTHCVYLLQYLATGSTSFDGSSDALNKMLCDIEMSDPVGPPVELTAAAQELGRELLGAVIAQWTALGPTSPDGFRESFLQRKGLLKGGRDRADLTIEPKSFDVLLGSLPWGFSALDQPWMSVPLYTEWLF